MFRQTEQNVFLYRQIREQQRLLRNQIQTQLMGFRRGQVRYFLTFQRQGACIRLFNPCNNFHQRGFSRAVAAQQRMNLSRQQCEIDVFEDNHTGELFGYSAGGEQRLNRVLLL